MFHRRGAGTQRSFSKNKSLRLCVSASRSLQRSYLYAPDLDIPALILQRDGAALQRAVAGIDRLRAIQHHDDVVAAHGDFVSVPLAFSVDDRDRRRVVRNAAGAPGLI